MNTVKWNWQQPDWPNFTYNTDVYRDLEQQFLTQAGQSIGIFKHIKENDKKQITIKLISDEALKTSEIEGEVLDRDSLQSSIMNHFGLKPSLPLHNYPKENGIAEMMTNLHLCFDDPLTHEILWSWHHMLMNGRTDIKEVGKYRSNPEPMQIVSGYIHKRKVHYEAPPSDLVTEEMNTFIEWFNDTTPMSASSLTPLVRAGITHLYFESIHPFEDGNGRIGRALVQKVLAQHIKQPTLIALSQIVQENRKQYYSALSEHSKTNDIDGWLDYFCRLILEAQDFTINEVEFLVEKAHFFDRFSEQMNKRQQKVILRIFEEGTRGFVGGLSAKNYMSITGASPSTATRDLRDLIEKRILKQSGERKSTRYWLNLE